MPGADLQLFVKSAKGQVWGPLSPSTIGLMVENGLIESRGLTLSVDGVTFMEAARFPQNIRDFLPPEVGGGPILGGPPAAATAPAGGPIAGPGAPRPGPGVAVPGPPPGARAGPAGAPAAPAAARPAWASAPAAAASAPAAAPAPATASGSIPASGDLARSSPLHLYYLAASTDQTGLLVFKLSDRAIDVHFRKGNPEHVGSTHPEDSVAGFLLSHNLATPDQIGQADAAKDRFGGELIGALFGLGTLNPGSAFAQLAQRATALLSKALVAESGSFTWEPKDLPAHRAMPMGNRWAILGDVLRRVPAAELRRRLAPVMDKPVMKSGGRVAPSELRLTPQETRALGYIDGVRSLAQLAVDVPQEAEHLFRVAFFLRELEAVSFGAQSLPARPPPQAGPPAPPPAAGAPSPGPAATAPRPAEPAAPPAAGAQRPGPPAPPPAAPRPAPAAVPGAPQAGPGAVPGNPVARPSAAPPQRAGTSAGMAAAPRPGPGASPPAPAARPGTSPAMPAVPRPGAAPAPPAEPGSAAELTELRALAEAAKKQTLFEVLGLPQNADAGAVKLAYFKMAKLYHPDTIPPGASAEVAKLKADIFARVGDAYRRLGDDKSRAEYLEELKSGGSGEGVDVQQILMAEELFQKGSIMVKAKKFADAVTMLNDAIKANPDEGEFYAWRGYAKYFAAADKKVGKAEADKDLQLSIKKNDRCAQAYYFIGHIAKLSGDNATAMKNFQKTIELRPDHVDAQREVRMSPKK